MYKMIFVFLMSLPLAHSSFSDNIEGTLSSLDLYKLGYQFEVGIDQEADQAKAHTYYQKAATNGYAEAQYKLGRLNFSSEFGLLPRFIHMSKHIAWSRIKSNDVDVS